MSIVITVATQCQGTVCSKRYRRSDVLCRSSAKYGAQIILCDPHRVVVVGPQTLRGGKLHSPDVRAGMAMLIAGLCSVGKTEIFNIGQIDRGYERIEEKLKVGAAIKRVSVDWSK